MTRKPGSARLAILTTVTMIAFAANSVLCRLALGARAIDAASFTTIRLVSGALVLALILRARHRHAGAGPDRGNWTSAGWLFVYAVCFSFAYISLSAGTGALMLFGAVQATMIVAALRAGERPRPIEWIGLVSALGGLVYLVAPGLTAPAPLGSVLMATAGLAWGMYSLRGRRAANPVAATAGNFARAVPPAVVVSAALLSRAALSPRGVILAVISGAVASGMGYVLWYAALRGLSATQAAIVQLSVPVIAAAGGVVFIAESVTARLVISSVLILGGVAAAVTGRGARRA